MTRLIFVYNAEAGLLHAVMDSLHKTLSPQTYACDLCAITYGFFTMDKHWRAYLKSLPYATAFYYRRDFRRAYPAHTAAALPLIGLEQDGAFELLLGAEEIKSCKDVNALVSALDSKLSARMRTE